MPIDRSFYKNLLNRIETDYPVTEWMHNGYHIWPILRIYLYLSFTKKNENRRGSSKRLNRKSGTISRKIQEIPEAVNSFLKLNKNINAIYFGAPSHRVTYQGEKYNRYFDPLMDNVNEVNLLIEYNSDSKENYHKPERVLLFSVLDSWYNLYFRLFHKPDGVEKISKELEKILSDFEINIDKLNSKIGNYILKIDQAAFFCDKILRKSNPEKVYILCYYSASMFGLNIAAHKLGIPTVDMQHGPQGEIHMAYGHWQNVPNSGYEALPNEFHTWDQSSTETIESWAKKTRKHSAIVTGNPWINGWKRGDFTSSDYPWPENLVLYTLQPTDNPLDPYLLETMEKTSEDWDWWLRLHPRQLGEEKDIKHKLDTYGLLDNINIDDATTRLLPEILVNTKVHLTKFSGCAIEAFELETPTIVLDERGKIMFKDYLGIDNMMSSCIDNDSDLLIKAIQKHIS